MLHTLWTVIGSTQEPTLSGSFDLKLKPVFSKNIFEINVLHSLSSSNSFTQWGLQVRRFKHLVYFCKILCLSKSAKHMIKKNSITRSTKVGYYQENVLINLFNIIVTIIQISKWCVQMSCFVRPAVNLYSVYYMTKSANTFYTLSGII